MYYPRIGCAPRPLFSTTFYTNSVYKPYLSSVDYRWTIVATKTIICAKQCHPLNNRVVTDVIVAVTQRPQRFFQDTSLLHIVYTLLFEHSHLFWSSVSCSRTWPCVVDQCSRIASSLLCFATRSTDSSFFQSAV